VTAIGKAAEWVRGGSLTDEEWVHFYERGSLFFVDNQRGKKIDLRFCNRTDLTFALEPSLPSGHIYDNVRHLEQRVWKVQVACLMPIPLLVHDQITVTLEQAVKCSQEHQVDAARSDTVVCPITATHHATGEHVDGEALLLRDSGWSVISDIDDTIKITMVWHDSFSFAIAWSSKLIIHTHQVKSKSAMLRQTFLKPFIPVDGMAALYTVRSLSLSLSLSQATPLCRYTYPLSYISNGTTIPMRPFTMSRRARGFCIASCTSSSMTTTSLLARSTFGTSQHTTRAKVCCVTKWPLIIHR